MSTELIDWLKPTRHGLLGLRRGMTYDEVQSVLGEGREQTLGGELRRWNYTWSSERVLGDVGCITRGGSLSIVLVELGAHERDAIAEAFNTIAQALDALATTEGPKGRWLGAKFEPRRREWSLDGTWKLSMGHDVRNEGMPIVVALEVQY